jgi:16S rRNA (cytosine1402-N4)-methyltransferase
LAGRVPDSLSGVLFDLGVSSPQLDVGGRGFSFRADAAIDMRMDQSVGATAGDLVNELPESALAALFRENGEGRLSGRIAHAVVAARPLTSTVQLADVVSAAVPAAVRRKGHPAKRVFQALRIAVNDELGELAAALPVALERLAVGGRCAVISYHSGEDRLTKQVFANAATGGCVCPPSLPCVCGAVVRHELVFRGARRPREAELAGNRRAASARLRAIARTVAD